MVMFSKLLNKLLCKLLINFRSFASLHAFGGKLVSRKARSSCRKNKYAQKPARKLICLKYFITAESRDFYEFATSQKFMVRRLIRLKYLLCSISRIRYDARRLNVFVEYVHVQEILWVDTLVCRTH